MLNAVTAATIDQNIKSDSSGEEFEPKILKQPEQDRGTSPRLKYGIGLGLTQQDISSEEGIQRTDLSSRSYVRVQWVPCREFHSSPWKTESPTTDEGLEPITKNPSLDFQRRQMSEQFDVIAQRENNWDGYESQKPNELSLDHAKRFMEEFFDVVVSEGQLWLTPLISSEEDGHITVEWYGEERQLHLQIEEDKVVYIQVWGANIETEMHVDTLHSKDYLTLWKWLLYG